jgi:death-on-curing protein
LALDRPLDLHVHGDLRPDHAAPAAAACGFGLALNHPFVDGDKRTDGRGDRQPMPVPRV